MNNYPFLGILWTMLIIFAWVIWFWLLITVFSDLFRRHDMGGFAKVIWIILVIIFPFLGVFIYILVEHQGMAERNMKQMEAAQKQFDEHVKAVAATASPTDQIAQAKQLLDSGAITQPEFDAIKAKALG